MATSISIQQIQQNYQHVVEQVGMAAARSGHDAGNIQLVVVTKTHPIHVVEEVIRAGIVDLGENYVDEALEKIHAISDASVRWHMIGHVQSRKAKMVCENFVLLHSLDSLKLACRLDRFCGELGVSLPVLLQLNVSGENTKSGWPAWEESQIPGLFKDLEQVLSLPHLRVQGLMGMPPFFDEPELARQYFLRLRVIRDLLDEQFPSANWEELSMGMSGDFEVAVEEGATILRVGQAILGPRPS